MDDIYENIEEYSPNKERKTLIFFGDMIADMISNKKIIYQKQKTKHFSCFYYTILFCSTKKY